VLVESIPTFFDGWKFRSRTEARWAVFFKETKTDYIYEAEGYEIEDSVWYLPDFYLTKHDSFVEIKGVEPSAEEYSKCRNLCKLTEKSVFLVWGVPGDCSAIHFHLALGKIVWNDVSPFIGLFDSLKAEFLMTESAATAKQYIFGSVA